MTVMYHSTKVWWVQLSLNINVKLFLLYFKAIRYLVYLKMYYDRHTAQCYYVLLLLL